MPHRALTVSRTLACLVALSACTGSPTELVVVVGTDMTVPCDFDRVRLVASGDVDVREVDLDLADGSTPPLPLSLVLAPTGGLRQATVSVEAFREGARVVERRAVVAFTRGQRRVVTLTLSRACAGVTCVVGQTCVVGECADERATTSAFTGIPPADPAMSCVALVDAGPAGEDAGPPGDDAGPAVDCTPGPGACDDRNPCTDDRCEGGLCVHAANSAPCDDGLFCNGADTCRDRACAHAGSPCAGGCDEGTDTCAECTVDADCGPVRTGPFGPCEAGAGGECSETGARTQTVITPTCDMGICADVETTRTEPCARGATEHRECAGGHPMRCCGGSCVDTSSDTRHCGGCGLRCGAGFSCGERTVGGVVYHLCRCGGFHADCPTTGFCSTTNDMCSCVASEGGMARCPSPAMVCVNLSGGADACAYR